MKEAACFTEATSGMAMHAVAQWSICLNGITAASKNFKSFFMIEECTLKNEKTHNLVIIRTLFIYILYNTQSPSF